MDITIITKIDNEQKEDKGAILKLVRIQPNGDYGNAVYENALTKEQRIKIEEILGISLEDYKRD